MAELAPRHHALLAHLRALDAGGGAETRADLAARFGVGESTLGGQLSALRTAGHRDLVRRTTDPMRARRASGAETCELLRQAEREIDDALRGNVRLSRLRIRLRTSVLPMIREAIASAAPGGGPTP